MKRTQIKRPVGRKSRGTAEEQGPGLLPLTAREFLKLPGVLESAPSVPAEEPGDPDERIPARD